MNPLNWLASPQMLHALAVHIPVALGILGVPLVFVCAVLKMNNATLRWVAFALYVVMALAAVLAMFTGENARDAVGSSAPPDVRKLIETHEWFAEKLWMFSAATAVLILACVVKREWFRNTFAMLAVLAAAATGVWLGIAGHYGATLVYRHGVGTPGFEQTATPEIETRSGPEAPAPPPSRKLLEGLDEADEPQTKSAAPPLQPASPKPIDKDTGERIEP